MSYFRRAAAGAWGVSSRGGMSVVPACKQNTKIKIATQSLPACEAARGSVRNLVVTVRSCGQPLKKITLQAGRRQTKIGSSMKFVAITNEAS
jgi:hypothetical protein